MKDNRIFERCVARLESRFGQQTKQHMMTISGIVTHELKKLEHGYDKESMEALANLYVELREGTYRLTRNSQPLGKRDREHIQEFYGRALDAGLSRSLQRRNLSSYAINGDIVVAIESRDPRTAFLMFNFYVGNIPDFNKNILHRIESKHGPDGILEYVKQPIKLRLS